MGVTGEPCRSEITINLGALRRNARRLREAAGSAELWAVVKADGYGHGMVDCARAALEAEAAALCVATVPEGRELRRAFRDARIIVMSALDQGQEGDARRHELEVCISSPAVPDGLRVHAKIDTGMGRWGMSPAEAAQLSPSSVIGAMSHLATADMPDEEFTRGQLKTFGEATGRFPGSIRHIANSAATLRFPEARLDAVRCGVALYGLSPFGDDPETHGLEPVLSWRSYVAMVKELQPGASTGYGRRYIADQPTRIGIVPVGYGDGWRRGLTGTAVLVGEQRSRVIGTISMDSFAVELTDQTQGSPVTLLGDGIRAEEHARILGTINYELMCGIDSSPLRARRVVIDR